MSIYATLWQLQFPRDGDAYPGCEGVDVMAQGVPAHVGTPTPGYGYEAGDPFGAFLPPAVLIEGGISEDDLRAVVFVSSASKKGTTRSGQEYESVLLVLTGAEYAVVPFQTLHDRLCAALRGTKPRLVLTVMQPDSSMTLVFEDGSKTHVRPDSDPSDSDPSRVDTAATTMASSSSFDVVWDNPSGSKHAANEGARAMRKAIYSGPNRSGVCVCGHTWDQHHLGVVMRPEALETDGGPEEYIPQECEHFGFDEMGGLDDHGNSHCRAYRDTLDRAPLW